MVRESKDGIVTYRNSGCDSCQQSILKLDLYRQPYKLLLPDGKNEYRTCGGSLLSLCTMLVVLWFASIKILAIVTRADYRLQNHEQENFF